MASSVKKTCLSAFFLYLFQLITTDNIDAFNEELLIKPMPSGHLYSHFHFTTRLDKSLKGNDKTSHFKLFPRSLGELVLALNVSELHFSLTQGLWRQDKWGYPVRSAPPGAELWVWFHEDTPDVQSTWKSLVNSLSGQFCASLNFIDTVNTISPQLIFPPLGAMDETFLRNVSYLRYAALPKESVCTENLTPWKKILPCDSHAGLSQLLNAVHVFSANYFSLAVDIRPICRSEKCDKVSLELKETLSVVFDPTIKAKGKQDWSLMKTFGAYVTSACPVSEKSLIYVDITSNNTNNPFTLLPKPTSIVLKENKGEKTKLAVFDLAELLSDKSLLNIKSIYKSPHIYWLPRPPPLHASRYITGYGLERGGIQCDIHNHLNHPIKIIYLEVIPWFLRVYAHTIKISSREGSIKPDFQYYKPARDRKSPHHLELVFKLPAKSQTHVSFDFERAFLKWTEYPPDANHGFYINSAVIAAVMDDSRNFTHIPRSATTIFSSLQANNESHIVHIYTDTLLVTLPTPDFSMPYNAICLTCTVVALAFGPIHNITTKRLHPVDSKKVGWFCKIKNYFGRIKGNEDESTETKKNL